MTRFSDETLMAFVDRELDAASTAALEAAIARDPELAARVARQRNLRFAVHAAYEPVLEEPMPQRLLDATRGKGASPARESTTWRLFGDWTRFQWGAIAASITLGLLIGAGLWREAPVAGMGADLVAHRGQLLARGALARALAEQLASAQPSDAAVQIGLTFVSNAGEYCRTFALEKAAGLACKGDGDWRVEVIAQQESSRGSGGEYRMAAAGLPPAVLNTMKDRIQGDALDAEAERAAQQRGWTRGQ